MYALTFEWSPVIQSLLIKSLLIAGGIALGLLVVMFLLRQPKKFIPKVGLTIAVFVIALGALFVPPYLKGPSMSAEKAIALIEEELEALAAPGADYAALFGLEPTRTEEVEVRPGNKVVTRVFLREEPIEIGGTPGQFVQRGRVTANRKTGEVSVAISEFPQFPECKQQIARLGSNSDADGQVIGAPMRFVPDANPALPFTPPATRPGPALVVTNYNALQVNHPGEFPQLKAYLESLGTVLDTSELGSDEAAIRGRIREIVKRDDKTALFIFGNADVVPFKKRVNPVYGVKDDHDIIFGDDYYGDLDDDPWMLPDIDVGRIPDDPAIVRNPESALYKPAISAKPLQNMDLCSIANFRRPSSALLVEMINPVAENENMFWCMPHDRASLPDGLYRDRSLFVILHGCASRSHRYRGEDKDDDSANNPVGLHVETVQPAEFVWSSACYGSYVVGKTAEDSVALAFLAKGCRAFVGFSGSHYSNPDRLISGGQLFLKLFLEEIKEGYPPSTAFRLAKHSYSEQLITESDKKNLAQGIYFGIPALQPVKVELPTPPEGPATPKPIATVAGVPPTEPPALATTFGTSSLEPAGWVIPKSGSQGGNARVGNGSLQLSTYGAPPAEPLPVLASPPERPFVGDWTVAVRVRQFQFRGTGRYGLNFTMATPNRTHVLQHGLQFDEQWGDQLWRTTHGASGEIGRQPLEKMHRAITLVMKKVGNLISFFLNRNEVHTMRLAGAPAEPFTFSISHDWGEGAQAEIEIDYVYLFGERGEAADEPEPEPQPGPEGTMPQPTPRALVDRYFDAYRDENPQAVIALLHPDSDLHESYDLATLKEVFADSDIDRTILEFMEVSSDAQSAEVYVLARNEASPGAEKTVTSFDFTLTKVDGGWLIDDILGRDILGRDIRGFTPPEEEEEPAGAASPRDAVVGFFSAFEAKSVEKLIAVFHPESKMREALMSERTKTELDESEYEFDVLDMEVQIDEAAGTATVRAKVHGKQTTIDGEVDESTTTLTFELKQDSERWLIMIFGEAGGGMLEP